MDGVGVELTGHACFCGIFAKAKEADTWNQNHTWIRATHRRALWLTIGFVVSPVVIRIRWKRSLCSIDKVFGRTRCHIPLDQHRLDFRPQEVVWTARSARRKLCDIGGVYELKDIWSRVIVHHGALTTRLCECPAENRGNRSDKGITVITGGCNLPTKSCSAAGFNPWDDEFPDGIQDTQRAHIGFTAGRSPGEQAMRSENHTITAGILRDGVL